MLLPFRSYRPVALALVMLAALLSAPASAGPPFATDDPGVFPVHSGEAYLFAAGSHSAGGDSLDAAPGVEVNYSFLAQTFVHLVVPMSFADPRGGGHAYGPGDIELGFKWRFLTQSDDGVDVATFPLAELPSGDSRRALGSRQGRYFVPLWLQKDVGPWTVYGGGGRWFGGGPGKRDWTFTGMLVQRQLTPSLYLGGELFHQTAQTPGGSASTGFNIGGGYTLGGRYQLLFSAGRNLTDVADNRFSFYLALYRTF